MQLRLMMAGMAAVSAGLFGGWALLAIIPAKRAALQHVEISGPSIYVVPRPALAPTPAPPIVEVPSKPAVLPASPPAPTAISRKEEPPKATAKTRPTPAASNNKQRIRIGRGIVTMTAVHKATLGKLRRCIVGWAHRHASTKSRRP